MLGIGFDSGQLLSGNKIFHKLMDAALRDHLIQ